MTHVPRPYPVPGSAHYADVFAIPTKIDNIPRPPDDFQLNPEHKLRKSTILKLKEAKKRKKYTDYNAWKELVETGHISDSTVPELNKYLRKHNLQLKGKKNVKLDTIKRHVYIHIGDEMIDDDVYNFERNNENNADGEESENERADDVLSGGEDSDECDENTFVLNIISDSDSEHSVPDFPGNDAEEELADNNSPLVNITLRSGRTATRFFLHIFSI
ncbi:Hypothetical predicted protein [Paramuricea clavata]|uniref:Uncharacterized protein n=1 Tax=Paramuricea clavata TaxID=317549 RepID=A0A6S7H3A8_PARCT|nr:Hypothetical predicted protein [Paramuricea clavata]